MESVADILDKLATEISEAMPNDHWSPSVVISKLKSGAFYVSIGRFRVDQNKEVICKSYGNTLGQAIQSLYMRWTDYRLSNFILGKELPMKFLPENIRAGAKDILSDPRISQDTKDEFFSALKKVAITLNPGI